MSLLTKNSTPREVDLFLPWCLRSQLGVQHTPPYPQYHVMVPSVSVLPALCQGNED